MAILSEPGSDNGAGGQMVARAGGGGHRGVTALAVSVLLLGVVGGTWWLLRRSATEPGRSVPRKTRSREQRASVPGPGTGTIEIESQPAGASVAVDGRVLGQAPQRVELPAGAHQIGVRKDGFEPFVRDVHVVPGHTARVSAQLSSEPPRLRVDSDVPGALVYLDRKPLGRTPLEARPLAPGSHRLNVTAEGYEMYSETIETATGTREVMVRFKEVRLDEAIDVVHKHAVGSCHGRLLATVAGLRYETAEGKDGFRAPFSGLDPLRTDYLAKSLRVKLKGGRTYNFSADSADTLLSFERAVEAARRRL